MVDIVSNSKARFLCPHCDKTYSSKSGVKGHMRTKHVDAEPIATDKNPKEKQQNNADNPSQEEQDKIDMVNLNTNELESLLEEEEEFLDAVESLEDQLGLNVDLTVNDSMISFLQNNYNSDFARTMEVEESVKTKKEVANLNNELKKAKKTITFLREQLTKDGEVTKALKEECTNGAKEYKGLSSRYRSSKRTIRELEEQLNSNRYLLSKTTSENLVIKQSSMTKAAMESMKKQSKHEDIMFACEECDFKSKNKQELQSHAHANHSEAEVEIHMEEKSKALHKCTKCPAKFRQQDQLYNHMESHEFHCFYKGCGCQTETEEQMISHIDDYHMLKVRETEEQVTETHRKETKKIGCGQCNFETNNEEEIKIHMNDNHKERDTLSCNDCNFKTSSGKKMNDHIITKHTNNNTRPVCRFFLQGRCNRPECTFKHDKTENHNHKSSRNNIKCNRGLNCHFKAQNRCFYLHEVVEIHMSENIQQANQNKEPYNERSLYCKHQDKCTKTSCPFKHFLKPRTLPTSKRGPMFI